METQSTFLVVLVLLRALFTAGGSLSRVQILSPASLVREGGYDHRPALFGRYPLQTSIIQDVFYTDSELCSDDHPVTWPPTSILMIDRGGCTFVSKTRRAQQSGVVAVIVANNVCQCRDANCMDMDSENCEENEPVLADDGSGSDITIPTLLLFKQDADAIKQVLQSNQTVTMELSWIVPTQDPVKHALWSVPVPIGAAFYETQRQFFEFYPLILSELGDRTNLIHHHFIYNGTAAGCRGLVDGSNQCYNLCTNNGRYCQTDPDNDLDIGIAGADIVKESLRRLCISEIYPSIVLVEYIKEFNLQCSNDPDLFVSDDCVRSVYSATGLIDELEVNNCVISSGGIDDDTPNQLLENELVAVRQNAIVSVFAFSVNECFIPLPFTASNVLSSICSGFPLDVPLPTACELCSNCTNDDCIATDGNCDTMSEPMEQCTLACLNGGTCTFGSADFSNQPVGTDGLPLDIHIQTSINGMYCECLNGFTGVQCAVPFELCQDSGFCYFGGLCHESEAGLFCTCLPGYVGRFCEIPAQICDDGSVCLFGSSCLSSFNTTETTDDRFIGDAIDDDISNTDDINQRRSLDEAVPDYAFVKNGCNCSTIDMFPDSYAGQQCEYRATVYCSGNMAAEFCVNGGTCAFEELSGFVGCSCPIEFEGVYCELPAETAPSPTSSLQPVSLAPVVPSVEPTLSPASAATLCPDGHPCFNNAQCVESLVDNAYTCNCTDGPLSVVAGASCEYQATSFCSLDEPISKTHFCTNGGLCFEASESSETFQGCLCPDGFEGVHCEYLFGAAPASAPNGSVPSPSQGNGDSSLSTGGIVGIAVGVGIAALVGGLLAFYWFGTRKRDTDAPPERSDEPQDVEEGDVEQEIEHVIAPENDGTEDVALGNAIEGDDETDGHVDHIEVDTDENGDGEEELLSSNADSEESKEEIR